MSQHEAVRAILAKTHEVIALARRLYPTYTHPTPAITFDIRGRSCGGRAWGSRKLQFNLDWYNANPEAYLKDTVTHEVAHIVASATGLGKGHNRGWRVICFALGGNGKRCGTHEEVKDVPKARRTVEHLYLNSNGREVWIGPVHHNRLQARGRTCPITGRPGYRLTYKSDGSKVTRDGYQGRSRMKA